MNDINTAEMTHLFKDRRIHKQRKALEVAYERLHELKKEVRRLEHRSPSEEALDWKKAYDARGAELSKAGRAIEEYRLRAETFEAALRTIQRYHENARRGISVLETTVIAMGRVADQALKLLSRE